MRDIGTTSKAISFAAGIIAVTVGILSVGGWVFHVPILRSGVPGFAPIRANMAVALILMGSALILLQPETTESPGKIYRIAQILSSLACLIGILTLLEYASGWDPGIDHLLVKPIKGDIWTFRSVRMPMMAAWDIVLTSLALILIDTKLLKNIWPSQFLAFAATLIALLAITGYTHGVRSLYSIGGQTQMALYAAIVFIFLGLGIILSRPGHGVMLALVANSNSGKLARRLLIVLVAVSMVAGPLVLYAERRGFSHGFGESVFTLMNILLLSFVVFITAMPLYRSENAQTESAIALKNTLDNLETRVRERTSDLSKANRELQAEIKEREAAEANVRLLSTPVLRLRNQLLVLPIIGSIDASRAQQLTDQLLDAIGQDRAKIVLLDVTGTAIIDSPVALHIIQAAEAARLLGATVIATGISVENARTLVKTGIGLSNIKICSDLQSGIDEADRLMGYKTIDSEEAA